MRGFYKGGSANCFYKKFVEVLNKKYLLFVKIINISKIFAI